MTCAKVNSKNVTSKETFKVPDELDKHQKNGHPIKADNRF